MSSRAHTGRYSNNEDSDYSDDDYSEDDQEEADASQMQLALRDKEEYLVQTALERIRRAQMLGKRNVRLSPEEMNALDAYEKKRRRQKGSPTKGKDRRSGWSRPKADDKPRRIKDRTSETPPRGDPPRRSKARASTASPDESTPPYPALPYPDYPPPGSPGSPPLGYYGAPAVRPSGSSSRPSSRSASSQSLRQQQQQQHTPPLPAHHYPYQQPGRYFSVPEQLQPAARPGSSSKTPPLSRPLPDDPHWAPRARSTSNLVGYPPEQYAYQSYMSPGAQMDPRFMMQGRRNISGPPDVEYVSMRPPSEMYAAGPGPSGPYPGPPRPSSSEERTSGNEDEDDDDDDNGVQVEVVERRTGYETRVTTGGGKGGRQRRGGRR